MFEKIIEELRQENLCTHFILPLIGLNKFSFHSNFVNCYLTTTREIAVQVIEKKDVRSKCMINKDFKGIRTDGTYYYLIYSIPSIWLPDLRLFKVGKYSEMSELAKDTIRVQSGLIHNALTQTGNVETDVRLLALDKHPVLRNMWEHVIDPAEPIQGELLSIPSEKSYIELSTLPYQR